MAAGRPAGDRNEFRIATVLTYTVANPGQRLLNVYDMVGKGRARAQANGGTITQYRALVVTGS